MNLEVQLDRGAKAAALVNNEMFAEAFATVEQAIHDKWVSSPIRDAEGQHELRLMLKLLQEIRTVLETTITDGKLAGEELKRKHGSKLSYLTSWMGR